MLIVAGMETWGSRRGEEKRREENMGWTAETRRNGRKEGCLVPSVGAC
jgi:hypothetical protein